MKFFPLAFTLILALFGATAHAASFSREQVTAHPCLEQVSLPWKIAPADPATVPEAYKNWPTLSAGFWGGSLCHVLVIKRISPEGIVDFTYAVGKPFYGHGEYVGVITEIDGVQHLKGPLLDGIKVEYTLNKFGPAATPFFLLEGTWQAPNSKVPSTGTFKPVKVE